MFNSQFAAPESKVVHLGPACNHKKVSESTVKLMAAVIRKAAFQDYVRYWAEHIVMHVPARDKWGEVNAIFNFIQQHVRYGRDPLGREYIQTPKRLLQRIEAGELPTGDCDCETVLGLALAKSLGFKTRIKIAGYKGSKFFTHVYGLVNIDDIWVPMDMVRMEKGLGWEGISATKTKTFQVR